MKTITVKSYPAELHIMNKTGLIETISTDGTRGEFTRQEWKDTLDHYSEEDQKIILDKLDMLGMFAED